MTPRELDRAHSIDQSFSWSVFPKPSGIPHFFDVKMNGNDTISSIYGIVFLVNLLYDWRWSIIRQIPIFRDTWATLSSIWPNPVRKKLTPGCHSTNSELDSSSSPVPGGSSLGIGVGSTVPFKPPPYHTQAKKLDEEPCHQEWYCENYHEQ